MHTRIILVDDHVMLRKGLRQTMAERPGLTVVGEASSGGEALELVEKISTDLILIDVHLPDQNGIEVTRQLLAKRAETKVIVYSSDASAELVNRALEAGACGYVWKQSPAEELPLAIETVMAGKLYLSPDLTAAVLGEYRKSLAATSASSKTELTRREKDLIRLIAEGRRNKEIAEELQLSPKSIETYRARLIKKLGCESTTGLVRYAIREGIIPA